MDYHTVGLRVILAGVCAGSISVLLSQHQKSTHTARIRVYHRYLHFTCHRQPNTWMCYRDSIRGTGTAMGFHPCTTTYSEYPNSSAHRLVRLVAHTTAMENYP
jgi:hypothetical protein